MKEWKTITSDSATHEPLAMCLHLGQRCHINLARDKNSNEKRIEATFVLGIDDGVKLEKTFRKKSQKPLNMEAKWAEDQAWDCLLEIADEVRRAQEMLVPDNK